MPQAGPRPRPDPERPTRTRLGRDHEPGPITYLTSGWTWTWNLARILSGDGPGLDTYPLAWSRAASRPRTLLSSLRTDSTLQVIMGWQSLALVWRSCFCLHCGPGHAIQQTTVLGAAVGIWRSRLAA